jgi:hypothetical protein
MNEYQAKNTSELKIYYSEPLGEEQSAYPSLNEAYQAPQDTTLRAAPATPAVIPLPPA